MRPKNVSKCCGKKEREQQREKEGKCCSSSSCLKDSKVDLTAAAVWWVDSGLKLFEFAVGCQHFKSHRIFFAKNFSLTPVLLNGDLLTHTHT